MKYLMLLLILFIFGCSKYRVYFATHRKLDSTPETLKKYNFPKKGVLYYVKNSPRVREFEHFVVRITEKYSYQGIDLSNSILYLDKEGNLNSLTQIFFNDEIPWCRLRRSNRFKRIWKLDEPKRDCELYHMN